MTPAERLTELQSAGRKVCGVKDVAAVLEVSDSAVYDAVAAGSFPLASIRIGRSIRFRLAELVELVGAA